ncbi:MAG: hypothetical protein IPL04_17775 [Chitinophagaceae bacterium]|nr:hypothetical protein [Chitinophagaceae bacterium]
MKHGKWFYYDPVWGRVEATETYVMNKLQIDDGSLAGDDDIRPIEISKENNFPILYAELLTLPY